MSSFGPWFNPQLQRNSELSILQETFLPKKKKEENKRKEKETSNGAMLTLYGLLLIYNSSNFQVFSLIMCLTGPF